MSDTSAIVARLADLTGALEATAEAAAALARARQLAATALLRGQPEPIAPAQEESAPPPTLVPLAPPVLETLRAEVEAAAARPPAQSETPAAKMFRRELPFITSQVPGSVPPWAAGLARAETLGPFLDDFGRPIWFDVIQPARLTRIVRAPGGSPVLALPLRGPLAARGRYRIPAGSLWLSSHLLAANAPVGGFSGVRITGGALELDASPTIVGDALQIPAGATATLTITLEQPAAATPVTGPGVDAGQASVSLPQTITVVCTPSGIAITAADPAELQLYGSLVPMAHAPGAAVYEPSLNRVLVPFTPGVAEFAVADSRSALFTLAERAPITSVAWALPVAVIDPGSLAEAAGAGALAVCVGPGLSATWTSLEGGRTRLNDTYLLAEPGRVALTALRASHRRGGHRLRLWQGSEPDRTSSLELRYGQFFPLRYFSEQSGSEAVVAEATMTANLDRPVETGGRRLDVKAPRTLALFSQLSTGFFVGVQAPPAAPVSDDPTAFALHNALICVARTGTLLLYGGLASDGAVRQGALTQGFAVRRIVPTLPDPYVANLAPPSRDREAVATGTLAAVVRWPAPDRPVLTFQLTAGQFAALAADQREERGDQPAPSNREDLALGAFLATFADDSVRKRLEEDRQRIERLEAMFDDAIGGSRDALVLLDVSTNADLLGVGFGLAADRWEVTAGADPGAGQVQIVGLDLVSFGRNVRVLTAPAISWEPVFTPSNPAFPFPPVLASADDGGPTRLGVNSVELVPIAPVPALEHLIERYGDPADPRPVAAMLTLPFGMRAVATLRQAGDPAEGPTLHLVHPEFVTDDARGGLQLRLSAGPPPVDPTEASPSFEGATIQTRNGTTIGGLPLYTSVLGGSGGSPVESIFNNEFEPGRPTALVPLTRYDVSGYGASVFSDWVDPAAAFALTSQVRFDVLVGRTAFEVVQVKSYLYPWGVPVVRTITLQRRGGGGVVRKDSGWQAMGPGTFQFPVPAGEEAVRVGPSHIHPGVVHGVFNVRNIRDTPREFVTPVDGGARLTAVTFDAEVRIERVKRGGQDDFVPTRGQLGFVQIEPSGAPLTRAQFRALLEEEGPVGGPVDCAVDVGGSALIHRVTRVDVGVGLDDFDQPVFVAAARGAPILPRAGAWSIVRTALATGETNGVDPSGATPLVRAGDARPATVPSGSYRFADPADVLREADPAGEYGFLHATGTQRVLYRRPKIEPGQPRVTSTQRPLLADTWSLLRASGVFPKAADCLEVPTSAYILEVYPDAEGELKLSLPFPDSTFALDPNLTRTLADAAQTRTFAQYANVAGDPTRVTLTFDSRAAEPWTFAMQPVSLIVANAGTETFRFQIPLVASASRASRFDNPELILGPPFDAVKSVLAVLEAIGLAPVLDLAMSNEWKLSGGFDVKLPDVPPDEASPPVQLKDLGAKAEIAHVFSKPAKTRVMYGVGATLVFWTISPAVKMGASLELEIEADPVLVTSIKTMVILLFGGTLLGGKAEARVGVGVEFGFGAGVFNFYGILMLKAEIKWFTVGPLEGFIGAAFSFELKGGWVERTCPALGGGTQSTWYTAGKVSVALEVTVCWVLTVSIEFEQDFYKAHGPELCPFEIGP